MGNEIIVTGTLEAPQVATLENSLAIAKSSAPGCIKDSDCKSSEYCSFGSCTGLGCPEGTEAESHDCVDSLKICP